MNTLTSTPVDTSNHPPSHTPVRRVSLPDRVALHVGLALITWSRRPHTLPAQPQADELYARNDRARERAAREAQWQLAAYQTQARR